MNLCKHVFPHEVKCECCFFGITSLMVHLHLVRMRYDSVPVLMQLSYNLHMLKTLNDGHLYSEALI